MENALTFKSALKSLNQLHDKGSFIFSKDTVGWDYDQLAWGIKNLLDGLRIQYNYEESNGSIRFEIKEE